MTKIEKVFKKWIKFMNDNGPMGKNRDHLGTDDFAEFCDRIEKEMKQLQEDRDNFNCGAMS